jgi:hypothetical protein
MNGWMDDGWIISECGDCATGEQSGIRIPAGTTAVGLLLSKMSRPAGPTHPTIQ